MMPAAEMVHWWFATGFLMLGLLLLAEAIAGREAFARRPWRRYLVPGLLFALGLLLWPVMTLFAKSPMLVIAHGSWAQALTLAGAAELGVAAGKLRSPYWRLCIAAAMAVGGSTLLLHERQGWFFSRAAFLHHALGWTMLVGALVPIAQALRPRSTAAALGFATVVLVTAVLLYSDRDVAPIFGHLSPLAGPPHR